MWPTWAYETGRHKTKLLVHCCTIPLASMLGGGWSGLGANSNAATRCASITFSSNDATRFPGQIRRIQYNAETPDDLDGMLNDLGRAGIRVGVHFRNEVLGKVVDSVFCSTPTHAPIGQHQRCQIGDVHAWV